MRGRLREPPSGLRVIPESERGRRIATLRRQPSSMGQCAQPYRRASVEPGASLEQRGASRPAERVSSPAMQPPDQPPTRWVPFAEAQKILGMSEGSLRRAIRDGSVTAEQRRRNPDSATDQRMVYEVLVSESPTPATASEAPSATESATEPPDVTMRLLELVAAEREERQRLVAENGALRERIGRAEAAREQALADTAAARAELARLTEAREQAARAWWRRILGR